MQAIALAELVSEAATAYEYDCKHNTAQRTDSYLVQARHHVCQVNPGGTGLRDLMKQVITEELQ